MAHELLGPRIAAIYEMQSAWLSPRLTRRGISWTTFQLLTAIQGAAEQASQAEIARRLGVTPATLSESVHAHVEKGLLRQTTSPLDRRIRILELTDQSRAMMGEIRELVRESERIMSRRLPDRAVASLTTGLDQVLKNLEQAVDSDE